MKLLLEFEANVNARNDKNMESYKDATRKTPHGSVSAIRNTLGQTALHAAAYRGHEDMVEMLLFAGADIEAEGYNGLTPL